MTTHHDQPLQSRRAVRERERAAAANRQDQSTDQATVGPVIPYPFGAGSARPEPRFVPAPDAEPLAYATRSRRDLQAELRDAQSDARPEDGASPAPARATPLGAPPVTPSRPASPPATRFAPPQFGRTRPEAQSTPQAPSAPAASAADVPPAAGSPLTAAPLTRRDIGQSADRSDTRSAPEYRRRDFSPEGRAAARSSWAPEYAGGASSDLVYQTVNRPDVPAPRARSAAPAAPAPETTSGTAPEADRPEVQSPPAPASAAPVERTITRRELRAMREAEQRAARAAGASSPAIGSEDVAASPFTPPGLVAGAPVAAATVAAGAPAAVPDAQPAEPDVAASPGPADDALVDAPAPQSDDVESESATSESATAEGAETSTPADDASGDTGSFTVVPAVVRERRRERPARADTNLFGSLFQPPVDVSSSDEPVVGADSELSDDDLELDLLPPAQRARRSSLVAAPLAVPSDASDEGDTPRSAHEVATEESAASEEHADRAGADDNDEPAEERLLRTSGVPTWLGALRPSTDADDAEDVESGNSLILPAIPEMPLSTVDSTGETMITGSLNLPLSLSSTGAHPSQLDASDLDHLLDPGDQQLRSTDSHPVRAVRAVSTHSSTRGVLGNTKPRGNRALTVLIVSAAGMAVAVVTLFIVGLGTGAL